jgi:hypothetical protein
MARFLSIAAVLALVLACTGARSTARAPKPSSDGESVDASADAGALCWDSMAVFLCAGNGADKRCAPAPGEGCVRCTCVVGNPSSQRQPGTTGIFTDRGDQNLMGQPRVP